MSALFTKRIDGWSDWAKVYQDREAFLPLARAIYRSEGLPVPAALGALTPGTNAVFRAGDTVLKVFAPPSSGLDTTYDFQVEMAMLAHAERTHIPTTSLRSAGQIDDAYPFRYLVLAYVDAADAGDALPALAPETGRAFARRMRQLTEALHRPVAGLLPEVDLRQQAITNERLGRLPGPLRDDLIQRAQGLLWQDTVLVHGDLTGENVLVTAAGEPIIIDWADAHVAPAFYELPPVLTDLFRLDADLIRAYAGTDDLRPLIAPLLDGIALHDFGADILIETAKRLGLPLSLLPTLDALGEALLGRWG